MVLRHIVTDDDRKAALREIGGLWSADDGTPEGDGLDVVITMVEACETSRLPLDYGSVPSAEPDHSGSPPIAGLLQKLDIDALRKMTSGHTRQQQSAGDFVRAMRDSHRYDDRERCFNSDRKFFSKRLVIGFAPR